jgi:two-component system alkaline phosphatase synthesis response regulator PhoP
MPVLFTVPSKLSASGSLSEAVMSAARTILTIEDDPAIRRGIVDALTFAGFKVLQAGNACEGERLALAENYDLLLLDVVLPDGTGLDLLSNLRERKPRQPVILLTARGTENDRVGGLQRGADDYVVKPFSVRELLARVEAVLRRAGRNQQAAAIDVPGRGRIDVASSELVHRDGRRVELSPREMQLVSYLHAQSERVVSREELLENVWGLDSRGVTTRTIDMHIVRLREKLDDASHDPQVIVTIRGRGYLWRAAAATN